MTLNIDDIYLLSAEVRKKLNTYANIKPGGGWQSACSQALADQLLPPGDAWKKMRVARLQDLLNIVQIELRHEGLLPWVERPSA